MMGRYAYDLATGKLTQNVVWDGDPFIACDDEPRHVGASWPSTDWIQSLEWERDYAARELADAVIDQPTHIEWSRDYYRRARVELQRVEQLYSRLYSSDPWMLPGALVHA